MKNRYYPQESRQQRLSQAKQNLAEAEAAYLKQYMAYQTILADSIPMLAEQQRAMHRRRKSLIQIVDEFKDEPLLAQLPLLEIKANMAMAKDPWLEERLRNQTTGWTWQYPVPPKKSTD